MVILSITIRFGVVIDVGDRHHRPCGALAWMGYLYVFHDKSLPPRSRPGPVAVVIAERAIAENCEVVPAIWNELPPDTARNRVRQPPSQWVSRVSDRVPVDFRSVPLNAHHSSASLRVSDHNRRSSPVAREYCVSPAFACRAVRERISLIAVS